MPKKASAYLLGIARAWLSQHVILQMQMLIGECLEPKYKYYTYRYPRSILFDLFVYFPPTDVL